MSICRDIVCSASKCSKMRAIGVVVEIVRPDDQRDVVAHVGQQQNAAQHGLFRVQIARRLAIENFGGDRRLARALWSSALRSTVAMIGSSVMQNCTR